METQVTIAEIKERLIQDLLVLETSNEHFSHIERIETVYQNVYDLLCAALKTD
ncbi:hypothetical protein UFOVP116_105 [uncultured Caudovirales phage]|uniref:Uncharacterized protein n=1 Tax=uncultured Caudovirales phage TaxID=2100421 RepID=A0A6J5L9N8_9CAUD|nr:hypothetical protein UFOVP116_105 [uncultured Caudovirales phage]